MHRSNYLRDKGMTFTVHRISSRFLLVNNCFKLIGYFLKVTDSSHNLYCIGKSLEDGRNLEDYGIKNESFLFVVVKERYMNNYHNTIYYVLFHKARFSKISVGRKLTMICTRLCKQSSKFKATFIAQTFSLF